MAILVLLAAVLASPSPASSPAACSRWWTPEQAAALPEAERGILETVDVGEEVYYQRYSTPLAYARPLDLLAAQGFEPRAKLVESLGRGYHLFLSKNTLKRGYVHPEKPVPERQRIDLGVSDEEYVRAVHAMLEPGGFLLIYNLAPTPAPEGKPYTSTPWPGSHGVRDPRWA